MSEGPQISNETPEQKERREACLRQIREARENMPPMTKEEFYAQMARSMGRPLLRIDGTLYEPKRDQD